MTYSTRFYDVEAFVFGVEPIPHWWIAARRKNSMLIPPSRGTVVAQLPDNNILFYDLKTFRSLFEIKGTSPLPVAKKPRRKRRTRAEMEAAKVATPSNTPETPAETTEESS